ncbi:MAG TPA: S8 family serine peptidase [Longimicrobiaceae bacterium]|nr:S8 family serine peptidase [Longimicrobiaceae bacterium]
MLRSDGRIIVGFKEPGEPRLMEAPRRPGTKGLRATRGAVSGASIRAGPRALEAQGVRVLDYQGNIGVAVVQVEPREIGRVVANLRNHPNVGFLEPDVRLQVRDGQDPPDIARRAQTQTIHWGINMVRAPQAWNVSHGEYASVIVIDSGHEDGHPDLFDLADGTNCGGLDPGRCYDAMASHSSSPAHGTRMMGIITATDNSVGTVGVAPWLPLSNIFSWRSCDANNNCWVSYQNDALKYAADRGIRVANMSLGGTEYIASTALAVQDAWNRGVVIVAAAGNDGVERVEYPAGYDNVIGVSGVKQDGTFAGPGSCSYIAGSNYGSHIDLSAPIAAYTTFRNGGYVERCSTSTATAYVSGAAVLVASANPSWTNSQIVQQLFNTANRSKIVGLGRDYKYGHGTVDVGRALGR